MLKIKFIKILKETNKKIFTPTRLKVKFKITYPQSKFFRKIINLIKLLMNQNYKIMINFLKMVKKFSNKT
jgi:hypothetical protein